MNSGGTKLLLHHGDRIYPTNVRAFGSEILSPAIIPNKDLDAARDGAGAGAGAGAITSYEMTVVEKHYVHRDKRPCR